MSQCLVKVSGDAHMIGAIPLLETRGTREIHVGRGSPGIIVSLESRGTQENPGIRGRREMLETPATIAWPKVPVLNVQLATLQPRIAVALLPRAMATVP